MEKYILCLSLEHIIIPRNTFKIMICDIATIFLYIFLTENLFINDKKRARLLARMRLPGRVRFRGGCMIFLSFKFDTKV